MLGRTLIVGLLTLIVSARALAGSLYLPLHLSPEIEARVERLFILADMPIIKRPIPIKQVQDALDRAAERDPQLVSEVRSYLVRYSFSAAPTHFNISAAASQGIEHPLANGRGVDVRSGYNASFSAYWVLNDFAAINLGGHIYQGVNGQKDEFAEGTFVSLGWDAFQLDLGTRAHWFSPFQENSMLLSTQAESLPSVTISNVKPFAFLGLQYELFLGQMSHSDEILSRDGSQRLGGNPLLFGFHLSMEPVDNVAIGINRLMQFGGADRDQSAKSLANAFINVKLADNKGLAGNDFGNQLSSITTRYTFQGKVPVSVYMEYAGEDTSAKSDIDLGNTSLSLGLHLPKIGQHLDFSYEMSEWQNGWYVNNNYGDGLTHYGSVLGNWGATDRVPGNAVGATAHMAKLIWDIRSGSSLTTTLRKVDNEKYSVANYQSAEEISVEYSQAINVFITGAKLTYGNDAFGKTYSQISGFIRW